MKNSSKRRRLARRQLGQSSGWPERPLHIRGLVAGRKADVLRSRSGRPASFVATAISDRRSRATHVRTHRRGRYRPHIRKERTHPVIWAPNGRFLYLGVQRSSLADPGKTRVIPLPPGEMLPKLPPLGMLALDDQALFPGSNLIDRYAISPGTDPSVFAYVKTTMQRNLFRIPLQN